MPENQDNAEYSKGERSDPPDLQTNINLLPPNPIKPRIWPTFVVPFLGLVLAVVLQMIVGAAAAAFLLATGTDKSDLQSEIMRWITSSSGFLVIIGCGQVGFALPTMVAAFLSPEPFRQRLGLISMKNPIGSSTLCAIGSILPLTVALGLVYLVAEVIPADGSVEAFFEQLTLGWGLIFVVIVALAPGFFEEMLFRGYIQRRLLARWSPSLAIGVASILFTLAHVTPHAMAVALPLGVWFGIIAWRVGSIIPCIVCHAFVNGGLNAWRLVIKFGELSETAQLVGNITFVGIGSVGFVLACRMLANCTPPSMPSEVEHTIDLELNPLERN